MKLKEAQEKVLAVVDGRSSAMMAFLQELLRIPTVNLGGREKECQEHMSGKLRDIGLKVDMWEPDLGELRNMTSQRTGRGFYSAIEKLFPEYKGFEDRPIVVGTLGGVGDGKSILLNGHVDVVTPEPSSKWTMDPWGGIMRDGKIFGRGAADMKAGVAAIVSAVDCIVYSGLKLKGDVVIQSVVDEEFGGNGTLACLQRGYRADAGIFTEPTDLKVAIAQSGWGVFRIAVRGKSVHDAFRWEGVNAIEKMMKLIPILRNHEAHRTKIGYERFPIYREYPIPFPIEIYYIRAGEPMMNMTAEECTVEGDYNSMPDEDNSEVEKELEQAILEGSSSDPWMKQIPPRVEFYGMKTEGALVEAGHPIVSTLNNAFCAVTGKETQLSGMPGGDGRIYTNSGVPSIYFGPGRMTEVHSIDEYVSVEDFLTCTKTLALTLLNWCGYE